MFFRKPVLKGPDSTHYYLRKKRSYIDRRSDLERRKTYSLDHFQSGGEERRSHGPDRRQQIEEQRKDWVRVSKWSSAYIGKSQVTV